MKLLNNWLNANKISLKVEKSKLTISKSPREVLSHEIKINSAKRLYPSNKTSWCKH